MSYTFLPDFWKDALRKIFFLRYVFSVAAKESLIKFGIFYKRCFNPPYVVSLVVTDRCNARCVTCDSWTNDSPPELSTAHVKRLLNELRSFTSFCSINFTGGEPLVRQDFFEIVKHASGLGFYTTVATNGIALNNQACDRLIEAGIHYINFSLNSIDPKMHDYFKGVEGLHEKIVSAIRYIKTKNKNVSLCTTFIIINDNHKIAGDFVEWAHHIGVDVIDFGPILADFGHNGRVNGPAASPASNPLLQIKDFGEFDRQIEQVIHLKKRGFPVVTPDYDLKMFKQYYRNPQRLPKKRHCHIGFRNLFILANGDVKLCYFFSPIGNIFEKDIKEIWFSKEAQRQRDDILSCCRSCASAALREFSLKDKFFIFLLRSGIQLRKRS